jgi:enamine deaminase RidA (YjgF/YER057c/UK114 family)
MYDPSHIELISPDSMHKPVGYSHVAKVNSGKPLFIAGQVALDPVGNLTGAGDFRAQARQVFENLKTAVEAVSGGFRDVVKLNVYVVDRSCLPQISGGPGSLHRPAKSPGQHRGSGRSTFSARISH